MRHLNRYHLLKRNPSMDFNSRTFLYNTKTNYLYHEFAPGNYFTIIFLTQWIARNLVFVRANASLEMVQKVQSLEGLKKKSSLHSIHLSVYFSTLFLPCLHFAYYLSLSLSFFLCHSPPWGDPSGGHLVKVFITCHGALSHSYLRLSLSLFSLYEMLIDW